MKIEKKYINAMGISLITVVIYTIFNNTEGMIKFVKGIFSPFMVFIIGAVIAFLLNPLLNILEKKVKLNRNTSVALIYTGLIAVLIMFIVIIVPQIFVNITDLVKKIPSFLSDLEKLLSSIVDKINERAPFLNLSFDKTHMDAINNYMIAMGENTLKVIGQNLLSFTYVIIEFFIGFIMSIFFLREKEYFKNLIEEVIRVNLPKEKSDKINFIGKKLYEVFLGYLHGKTIESLLIGFIAFIGLLYFKVPYAVLLWIFITCTNFIPYFGPFLGMIATVVITAFVFPHKIIYIVIFLVVLQQIDSWYFEPKIIGNKLNLKMFWGIAAVTVGGTIAGPIGIVVSAPLASFIKTMYQIKKYEVEKIENDV